MHSDTEKDESSRIFIKDSQGLFRAIEILSKEKVMGVDLESDSMFHYRDKICLVQISVPGQDMLIDTLSVKDLSPLSPLFSNPEIQKVFHGADYDIRSLFRDYKIEVSSLFDTQIAARLLGITQTGLSSILENRFGVTLDKKYQKSNWSKRPLSREMLQYAVQDTCYLLPLSRMFEKELRENRRLSWFKEECEIQTRVRFSPPNDDPLHLRFKGASKLPPRDLAILDGLLKWREDMAQGRDIPPFKILGNHQILEIINRRPTDLDGLEILSAKQVNSMGETILKIIQKAMGLHEDNLPSFPKEKRQKQSAAARKKIKALKEWRKPLGERMGLDPSIICPNSLIQAISLMDLCTIEGLKELEEIRKWQIALYGKEVCDLLASIPPA